MQALILASVFVATLTLTIGVYVFVNRRRLAAAESARARLRTVEDGRGAVRILKDTKASEIPALNRALAGDLGEGLARQLQLAGYDVMPGAFVLLSLVSGAAGLVIGVAVGGTLATIFWVAVGAAVPYLWIKRAQAKRLEKFQEQLPDAIDMLVSAMRAGYSFQAAMKFVGEEVPDPLGTEFARFYDQQRLGMDVRQALLAMQDRVKSMDLKMFVTAVLVQRESGGNLSEILGNIATIMRDRFRIKGEIETLTAEAKLSARILAALPVVVFFLIHLVNPAFARPMLVTPVGRFMLVLGAISVSLGYVAMMKIADIDI